MKSDINALFVPKRYGNYADTFLVLGLAKLAEYALAQTGHKREILLIDEGILYRLQFKEAVNLERISALQYTNLFPPVVGAKTDKSAIPEEVEPFDTVKQFEARKLYQKYIYEGGKNLEIGNDSPDPPDPRTQNGMILVDPGMSQLYKNYNTLWQEGWKIRDYFGKLVATIFEVFGNQKLLFNDLNFEEFEKIFLKNSGEQIPKKASAVKVFIPTAIQGINRFKANSIEYASSQYHNTQSNQWLSLWLIAAGLFEFGISEKIKIAERVFDWRVVILEPAIEPGISLVQYRRILNELRKYNPPSSGYGITRFDSELMLKLIRELLNYHPVASQQQFHHIRRIKINSIKDCIGNFIGTHFASKGKVYGLKEIFSLGLPTWISPDNPQDVINYHNFLGEHLAIIQDIPPVEVELLAAYRDFITGTNLRQFFPFQVMYAEYVVKGLAEYANKSLSDTRIKRPLLFSVKGLCAMTKKEPTYLKIIQDNSFKRIAQAINQSTVWAGKVKVGKKIEQLPWERKYGLAQRLSSQANTPEDFINELAAFLGSYGHENMRITEDQLAQEGRRRISVHKNDLNRLLELIHESGNCPLVANLLIAYGYASWAETKKEKQPNELNDAAGDQMDTDASQELDEEDDHE